MGLEGSKRAPKGVPRGVPLGGPPEGQSASIVHIWTSGPERVLEPTCRNSSILSRSVQICPNVSNSVISRISDRSIDLDLEIRTSGS